MVYSFTVIDIVSQNSFGTASTIKYHILVENDHYGPSKKLSNIENFSKKKHRQSHIELKSIVCLYIISNNL